MALEDGGLGSTRSIVALSALGVLMTSVLVTLPVLAAAMARQAHTGDAAIGILASADMLGCAVASLIIASNIKRFDWHRVIWVSLAGVVLGNFASMWLESITALLAVRFMVGFCGGAALSVVFVALCHTPNPDRSFAIFVFLQLVLQAVLLPLFALLYQRWGGASLYAALIVLALLALGLVRSAPRGIAARSTRLVPGRPAARGVWGTISVIALGVYFIAPAMIWAFFEPIGRLFDVGPVSLGWTLGGSAVAGIGGAATVLLLGTRLSRIVLMSFGIGLSILSLLPIYAASGIAAFVLVTCTFNFAWNFTFPYLMGVISRYDEAGEIAIYSLATQLLGLAAGPLLGSAILSSGGGYPLMATSALAILIISGILFARSEVIGRMLVSRPARSVH